jgi:Immunoglobulin V-set domain
LELQDVSLTFNFFKNNLIEICVTVKEIACLESVFLKIPEKPVYAGDDVTIECHYNLEDDRLGSIKWYKDNEIFMWYSPRDRVPIRGYPAVGVNLEEKLLRPYTITLKNVGVDSAGEYSCEVAAEAPSQQRQTATARLTVHGADDGRTT